MSIDKKKLDKAKKLGFVAKDDSTEDEVDTFIKTAEEEARIAKENDKKAAEAKKTATILKDTNGEEVDQADYFYPRITDEKLPNGTILKATDQTAPVYFNRVCGFPVDREDLIEVFNSSFRTRKGFLFYKLRDKEVYLVIVPLKYAKMVGKHTESQPGDFQKHALSFVGEGSVNPDSLKLKLAKIANHGDISKEALA